MTCDLLGNGNHSRVQRIRNRIRPSANWMVSRPDTVLGVDNRDASTDSSEATAHARVRVVQVYQIRLGYTNQFVKPSYPSYVYLLPGPENDGVKAGIPEVRNERGRLP